MMMMTGCHLNQRSYAHHLLDKVFLFIVVNPYVLGLQWISLLMPLYVLPYCCGFVPTTVSQCLCRNLVSHSHSGSSALNQYLGLQQMLWKLQLTPTALQLGRHADTGCWLTIVGRLFPIDSTTVVLLHSCCTT